jgi:hypothetical protein
MQQFTFDKSTLSYFDAAGNRIPDLQIRQWIDAAVDSTKAQVKQISQNYVAGVINHPEWFTQIDELITRMHSGVAQVAAGGTKQMTPKLLGRLGARVRSEKDYQKVFGLDVENGYVKLGNGLIARSEMYADSGVATFEQIRQGLMLDNGFTQVRNILGASDHCPECQEITDAGWMLIVDFTPIGNRVCLTRCRCSAEYR